MPPRQLLNTGIASAVLLGLLMVLAPGPALASNMWTQQTLLLVHLPQPGGLPYFTTGAGVQNFLVLVNPLTVGRTLTIQLYDTNGVPQGAALLRTINARGMQVLQIPGAFGLPTPPASGSVTIIADGNGY